MGHRTQGLSSHRTITPLKKLMISIPPAITCTKCGRYHPKDCFWKKHAAEQHKFKKDTTLQKC